MDRALAVPDLAPLIDRVSKDELIVKLGPEILGPSLAWQVASLGFTFELWLRGSRGLASNAAFDRAANKDLVHVYGPEYRRHDRVGGCHSIIIVRNASGRPIASSIFVLLYKNDLRGFRAWMEQVHPDWYSPSLERLLFELGHDALKFLALRDPEITHWFSGRTFFTVETALSTNACKAEFEPSLCSLGYSLCEAGDVYLYHKHIRIG
jgi:hypothetical protein